jgi:hypothetical protein
MEDGGARFLRNVGFYKSHTAFLIVTAVTSLLLVFTLMMEAIRSPKRRFLEEPHGGTS